MGTERQRRIKTVMVSDRRTPELIPEDAIVARTPLELIACLEGEVFVVDAVVFAGGFALDGELAEFVRESYPAVRLRHT